MPKNWIKLKRGLITGAKKHRPKMGEAIWLYVYLVDQADFETGLVAEYTDLKAGEILGLGSMTVRYQRRKLEKEGYIECRQVQHGQQVIVTKWVDPSYQGSHGGNTLPPSIHGGNIRPPSVHGGNTLPPSNVQGGNQGGNQGGSLASSALILHGSMIHEGESLRKSPTSQGAKPLSSSGASQGGNGDGKPLHPAIQAWLTRFDLREAEATPRIRERIIEVVGSDLPGWTEVLDYWEDNKHRPLSVGAMLERYAEQHGESREDKERAKVLEDIQRKYGGTK